MHFRAMKTPAQLLSICVPAKHPAYGMAARRAFLTTPLATPPFPAFPLPTTQYVQGGIDHD